MDYGVPLSDMACFKTVDFISRMLELPPFHSKDLRINAYMQRLESILDLLGSVYVVATRRIDIAVSARLKNRMTRIATMISNRMLKLTTLVVDFRNNQQTSHILLSLKLKNSGQLIGSLERHRSGVKRIQRELDDFFKICDSIHCENPDCDQEWIVENTKSKCNLPAGCKVIKWFPVNDDGWPSVVCGNVCFMVMWRKKIMIGKGSGWRAAQQPAIPTALDEMD